MTPIDADAFYEKLGDRTIRYGERPLDPNRGVALKVNTKLLMSKAGQAATLVAGELLSRMVRKVILDFDDVEFVPGFGRPLKGSMHRYLLDRMSAVAPFGEFIVGKEKRDDYVFAIGNCGHNWQIDGSDWEAYIGPTPSGLAQASTENIFGTSLAVLAAAARVFAGPFPVEIAPVRANLFNFSTGSDGREGFAPPGTDLGELWFAGAGSVGSATAYFLALAGYQFRARFFDMDIVKAENLDRSPVFSFEDIGKFKVCSVVRFLRKFGISALGHPRALAESKQWRMRQPGTPDVLISAANELDVRFEIETQLPPIQIYGTTGKDWQANMFHHIPPGPCSCCAFPGRRAVTACAGGNAPVSNAEDVQVDAALPFLSFAAGLMAAAELSKTVLHGYPFTGNRGFFTPLGEELLFVRGVSHRAECHCKVRSFAAHEKMIDGSKHAHLSQFIKGN